MSIVIKRAPFMEMTLLKSILATGISAVGGGDFSRVVAPVSSDGEARSIGFCLFKPYCAHELPICDIALSFCWHFMF